MRARLLVLILLLSILPVDVGATSGRALTAQVVMSDNLWSSADTVQADIHVSGAPYNRDISLTWELSDANGIVDNGSEVFQMSGSTHLVQLFLSQFYSGNTYYDLSIEVTLDSTIVSDNVPFTVLRTSLLQPASNLVIFGDSLSDMGNGNASPIVSTVFSSPPYWSGRFSNGPVWIEHVSDSYNLNTTFGDGISPGDNRAFGGSQTGQGYSYLTLPNTGSQINNYLANVQSSFSSNDVVFLWAGGNDFLYGTGNPDLISQNMASHIRALELAGASRFVVANLPPLELTPEGASRTSQQQATMASDVITYNSKLVQEVNNLSSTLNLDITLIDAWTIFHQIVNNADHVGITNTQDQACSGGATVPLVPLPICGSGANVVSNVDEYLFFDRAHPTATMHRVIGKFAVMNIGDADTDGDGVGDNADEDDDGDTWSDADEERCGSDSLDSESIPENIEDETTCVTVKTESKDDDDNSSSTMWWICVCFPLLLLLLLIPLIYWSREKGESLMVLVGMKNGPEPEHTTARPNFVNGSGTKNDPFVLKPGHVENFGDSCESKETITITNLDPESLITITDMASHTNRGRFNMDSILVEGNSEDKGSGAIVFTLKFDDNVTEDDVSGVYNGQIRIGSASVYILWEVKVGDPEADELAEADRRAKELKAQEDAERKAIKEAEAKDKADKKAAEEKAKAEKEAADKAAAEKEKSEKEAAEAKAKAEIEAADAMAKAEKEAAEKEAKDEADAKAKAEKEATEKKLKEAEDKAAAAEAKAKAAEDKAAAEKKAREDSEDAARVAAEKAAQERLEQMDREMEERRKKLDEMDEATRKKEEELLRISEKAKTIDFTTLGVAARSTVSKPVEKGATEVTMGDTSEFDESGSAWVQDDEGGMNISWTGKTATALTGVKGLKRGFAAAAMITASDDLQRIKGVGPFIEDKLNALGIYTFEQVGNMTSEIEEQVNIAIEFFSGRIKRDKWAKQAKKFADQK